MGDYESLSHSKWECKYHVVFIPKCRRKILYGNLRQHLGEVFHKLAEQKESRIVEGHLQPDCLPQSRVIAAPRERRPVQPWNRPGAMIAARSGARRAHGRREASAR